MIRHPDIARRTAGVLALAYAAAAVAFLVLSVPTWFLLTAEADPNGFLFGVVEGLVALTLGTVGAIAAYLFVGLPTLRQLPEPGRHRALAAFTMAPLVQLLVCGFVSPVVINASGTSIVRVALALGCPWLVVLAVFSTRSRLWAAAAIIALAAGLTMGGMQAHRAQLAEDAHAEASLLPDLEEERAPLALFAGNTFDAPLPGWTLEDSTDRFSILLLRVYWDTPHGRVELSWNDGPAGSCSTARPGAPGYVCEKLGRTAYGSVWATQWPTTPHTLDEVYVEVTGGSWVVSPQYSGSRGFATIPKEDYVTLLSALRPVDAPTFLAAANRFPH